MQLKQSKTSKNAAKIKSSVGRIDYHVQGTKPNADSAFAEYPLRAHTNLIR
jgi:hypothetical protein